MRVSGKEKIISFCSQELKGGCYYIPSPVSVSVFDFILKWRIECEFLNWMWFSMSLAKCPLFHLLGFFFYLSLNVFHVALRVSCGGENVN